MSALSSQVPAPAPAPAPTPAAGGSKASRTDPQARAAGSRQRTRISVEEAVREALANNRVVEQARVSVAIGRTLEHEARAELIPAITGTGTYRVVQPVQKIVADQLGASFSAGPKDVYGIAFNLSFPIFGFGRHLNNFRSARLARRKSEADRDTSEADIAAAVTAAVFDLLEGIRAVDAARANEEALDQQVRDSKALLEAGRVTKSALLEAQVTYDQARRERERFESAVPILRQVLNNLLGRPVNEPIEIVDEPAIQTPIWQEPALEEEALLNRPEVRAARLDRQSLERARQAAVGAALPELRANLGWEMTTSPFLTPRDQASLLLTLDIPIFTGGARLARIRRARRQVDLATLRLTELESQIRTEVARAYREMDEDFKDIAVAKLSVERSEESLRIQREKYKNGRATSREVLESTSLLHQARFALIQAVYSYKSALYALHRARGADPRTPPFFELRRDREAEEAQ